MSKMKALSMALEAALQSSGLPKDRAARRKVIENDRPSAERQLMLFSIDALDTPTEDRLRTAVMGLIGTAVPDVSANSLEGHRLRIAGNLHRATARGDVDGIEACGVALALLDALL